MTIVLRTLPITASLNLLLVNHPMPSISIGPYRIQFFEYDLQEKPHVHVWRENRHAKFWLTPVELFENNGYADYELNKIERLLLKERNSLLKRFKKEQKKR